MRLRISHQTRKGLRKGSVQGRCAVTPNDPKLSDRGVRRGTCMVGGKAAAEAGAVMHGAVRCSAWLGVAVGLGKTEMKLILI